MASKNIAIVKRSVLFKRNRPEYLLRHNMKLNAEERYAEEILREERFDEELSEIN